MEKLRDTLEKVRRWLDDRNKRKALTASINELVKHLGLKVMDTTLNDGHVFFLMDLQSGHPVMFVNIDKTRDMWCFSTLESLLEHLFSYAGFLDIDSMWRPVENIYYGCSALDEALVKRDLHISMKD